jgi:hypothetical protein
MHLILLLVIIPLHFLPKMMEEKEKEEEAEKGRDMVEMIII